MDLVANLKKIRDTIPSDVELVAVSKMKPVEMIRDLYSAGHLDFGENKVQDMLAKYEVLPKNIRWHMIGHLQSNKVKYIAPFVHLIHGVDSLKLLQVIDKEGKKNSRTIPCLLQVYIAREETKFGLDETELKDILNSSEFKGLANVQIRGLMGMASYTQDSTVVKREFQNLKRIFDALKEKHSDTLPDFSILSMGMSGDYLYAIEEGSSMIRVGSLIFGLRNYL